MLNLIVEYDHKYIQSARKNAKYKSPESNDKHSSLGPIDKIMGVSEVVSVLVDNTRDLQRKRTNLDGITVLLWRNHL